MMVRSRPLPRGPQWLREAFEALRQDFLSGRPITGIGTAISESLDGTAVNVVGTVKRIATAECCGDTFCFEDTIAVTDEEVFDLVLDLPFAFQVLTCGYDSDNGSLTIQQGYGPGGGSTELIDFGGSTIVTIDADFTVFDCDQIVPEGGFLQLNTVDFISGGPTSNIHYRICGTIL